jgi:hypothetical protein
VIILVQLIYKVSAPLFKIPGADGDVRISVSESAGEGVAALTITVGTSLLCNRKEFGSLIFVDPCIIIQLIKQPT